MVDIQTSRQLALLSSFDVRSRNLISRSVAVFKIFRFFNVQLIHKNETFRLTTGSTIFDDLLDMIVSLARHPLVLNTHRVTKLNQNVIHFMIELGVLPYKNVIQSRTSRRRLIFCIVTSHTGGNDICEFYILYIKNYIPRKSLKKTNKKIMTSWKWRKNTCSMTMRTKIGYLDGMPCHRSFDKPGIRRNKSFTTQ